MSPTKTVKLSMKEIVNAESHPSYKSRGITKYNYACFIVPFMGQ